jgi:hypothetical protein
MRTPPTLGDLNIVFSTFLKVAISLVGVAFIFMLLSGAFQYLAAAGDKEAVARAQKTFNYALRGLLLAVASWVVLGTLGLFFGLDFSMFTVCFPSQSC